MTTKEEKVIKDAQYRKGLSIAFFNATNNATKIAELEIDLMKNKQVVPSTPEGLKKQIAFWRDWLLDEHKKYYAENIANIGSNYDTKKAIEKIKSCKNIEELSDCWISLSEDERRDGDIIKQKEKLRKKYEEIQ